jgi:hypothetical protein
MVGEEEGKAGSRSAVRGGDLVDRNGGMRTMESLLPPRRRKEQSRLRVTSVAVQPGGIWSRSADRASSIARAWRGNPARSPSPPSNFPGFRDACNQRDVL